VLWCVGEYFSSLGCTRESRCTFLCIPRVALKNWCMSLPRIPYCTCVVPANLMLKCGRRSFFCPWSYGCLGPYCWRRTIRRWSWVLAEPGWIEIGVTCILLVSNLEEMAISTSEGDCGVDITCLYMVILAAPVTDRRWNGSVIGLDLVA
jgi:hypothetical protein